MVRTNNKKGAVELSLNLIIMLIIGMVVLGLVISFVTSLVGKGRESFDNELGNNEKLKLEEVKNCPDNLCVSPAPSLHVKKGSKTNIFIKVRAFTDIPINCNSGSLSDAACQVSYSVTPEESGAVTSGIVLSGPGFDADEGLEDSQMYTIKASDSTAIGTYYLKMELYLGDNDETTKTITVEVE